MPTTSAITLADAQATPVNHVFNPSSFDNATSTVWLTDTSRQNAVGFWRISVQTTQPKGVISDESVYRVRVGLHEPSLEIPSTTGNTAGYVAGPRVAYTVRSFHEFVIPARATLQERKDIYKMACNLSDNAQVKSAVEDLVQLN